MKIAIVGGGLSGALVSMHLLKQASEGLKIYLFEKSPVQLYKGVAYSSQLPYQLLNVAVKDMSLFADRPNHFLEWLKEGSYNYGLVDFVPRDIYGKYIADTFQHVAAESKNGVLVTINNEVTQISRTEAEYVLTYSSGQSLQVDKVVLCTGNFPPGDVPGLSTDVKSSKHYISHPWGGFNIQSISNSEDVLMVGSGLTMIDLVLSLAKNKHKGNITVISRRGLLPLPHGESGAYSLSLPDLKNLTVSVLVQWVRGNVKEAKSKSKGWRSVIDAMREYIPALWASLPLEEKKRFMRHLRPFWEIHRHRMPAESLTILNEMQQQHKLTLAAGKIQNAALSAGKVKVVYKCRNSNAIKEVSVDTIINCTGPETEYRKLRSLLYQSLIENKLAHPDVLSLGLDATKEGFIIEADGAVNNNIAIIGPPAKGILWECTALREIRIQAATVAKAIIS